MLLLLELRREGHACKHPASVQRSALAPRLKLLFPACQHARAYLPAGMLLCPTFPCPLATLPARGLRELQSCVCVFVCARHMRAMPARSFMLLSAWCISRCVLGRVCVMCLQCVRAQQDLCCREGKGCPSRVSSNICQLGPHFVRVHCKSRVRSNIRQLEPHLRAHVADALQGAQGPAVQG